MEPDHHPTSECELAIERQLNAVVGANLFDEQPPYLNSFFRFQLGSNTFDGLAPPARPAPVGLRAFVVAFRASCRLRACTLATTQLVMWFARLLRVAGYRYLCGVRPGAARSSSGAAADGAARGHVDPAPLLAYAGYEFAMEAWKRVASVGATTINTHSANGDQQSLESLRLQKDAVKRELKLFDVHFTKFYGTVSWTQATERRTSVCARQPVLRLQLAPSGIVGWVLGQVVSVLCPPRPLSPVPHGQGGNHRVWIRNAFENFTNSTSSSK